MLPDMNRYKNSCKDDKSAILVVLLFQCTGVILDEVRFQPVTLSSQFPVKQICLK